MRKIINCYAEFYMRYSGAKRFFIFLAALSTLVIPYYFIFDRNLPFLAAFLAAIALHECAHWMAFRSYGMSAVVFPIPFLGAATHTNEENQEPTIRQQIVIAFAGPVTNILLAVLAIPFLAFPSTNDWASSMVSVNALLAAANLIPYGPLDGASVVKLLMASTRHTTKLVVIPLAICGLASFFAAFILRSGSEPLTLTMLVSMFFIPVLLLKAYESSSSSEGREYVKAQKRGKLQKNKLSRISYVFGGAYFLSIAMARWQFQIP